MLKNLVWWRWLAIGAGLYASLMLARGLVELYRAGGRVDEAKVRLEELEGENGRLLAKLEETQTGEFVEKEARDKLNMQLPGETVVILPKHDLEKGQDQLGEGKKANWEKWWELFR